MNSLAAIYESGARCANCLEAPSTAYAGSYQSTTRDEPRSPRLDSSLSMLPSIADAIQAETNRDLKEAIESAIVRCEHALKLSRQKHQESKEDENAMFESDKSMLSEFHELNERYQHIYGEREKLFKRLPSNQVVNVTHNALLEGHEKESVLIDKCYTAVKLAKAESREHRARRFEQAQETQEREAGALEMQIAHLRNIAEIAGVALDRPVLIAQYEYLMDKAREPFSLPHPASQARSPLTPAKPRQVITPSADNKAKLHQGILNGVSLRQKPKNGTGSAGDETVKRCDEYDAALGSVNGDAQAMPSANPRKKAVNPYPEHDTLWGWMGKFVEQGKIIVSLIQERYEDEIDAASSQREREHDLIESGLRKRTEQRARIGKIRDVVGQLWETEKKNEKQWDDAWDMTNHEMKIIKKELESFENHVPRCDDKLVTRRKTAAELLAKQKRFYDALLYRVQNEAASRGLDLEISE